MGQQNRQAKKVYCDQRSHLIHSWYYVISVIVSFVVFVFSFQFGDNSGLHLIIFDEFDAVCKSRYSYNVSTNGRLQRSYIVRHDILSIFSDVQN